MTYKTVPLLVLCAGLFLSAESFAAETIKIGISGPMTGEVAAFGQDIKAGTELAVEDVNAKGGLLGKKLEAVFADDACDPKTAVAVANRFITQDVAMASHMCSVTCLPTSLIYAEENIPMFSFGSAVEITTRGLTNLIRPYPGNIQEAPAAAKLIHDHFAGRKLAILHIAEAFNKDLAGRIVDLLAKDGRVGPAFARELSGREEDFSSIITQLKSEHIEVVWLGFFPKAVGSFIRQAAAANYRPQFLTGDIGAADDIPKIAGDAADGLIFVFAPDPKEIPAAASFVARMAAKGMANRPLAAYYYLALQVYADAVRKAGTTGAGAVMKALKSNRFDTIMGPVTFDAKGDIQGIDFRYYQWNKGQYAPWKK